MRLATLADPAAVPKRMTVEGFLDYPWGDVDAELVRGEVRVTPVPSAGHARIMTTVQYPLYADVTARSAVRLRA